MGDLNLREPIHILLIEDNPGDVRLVMESFREFKLHSTMSVVEDGEAALAYLRRQGKFATSPRPDLVLLDLNLPKKNGREVLAEFKGDPDLKRIPVVVITSSSSREDVLGAYDHFANCYITKPLDLKQFEKVVRSIEDFWLGIVQLPSE